MSVGTMALEEGGRVDFARMREERFRRVLDAMEEHDLDVLLIGREANAQYVAGVRRLYLAGPRPFAPGCVVVRESGAVHLMSTWHDGIPTSVPPDHLYGISWNPLNLIGAVQKVEGVSTARRIGVDALSPLFKQLIAMAAPEATLVNASSVLRRVRARKTDDELTCITTAIAIAESSLQAAIDDLRPGVTERSLLGAFEGRMTAFGVTTPATEGTFCPTTPADADDRPHLRRLSTNRTIDEGALVALNAGVLYAGYEGGIGRTWPCTTRRGDGALPVHRELHGRWRKVWDRVSEACRPGATGEDLLAAYEASGEPLPDFPIAYSVGMGYEGAVAGSALGPAFDATQRIEMGMVLGIQVYVANADAGYFALETVQVTGDGIRVLSTMSHGPLADDR